MTSSRLRAWLRARLPYPGIALLGAVSATGFAPLDLWPLALAAFALWMALVEAAPTRGRALAIGWWFGLGHFIMGDNWIATAFRYQEAMPHWLGWVAVTLLGLYLALFPAVAAGLAWRWGRGGPVRFVLLLAAAWIVTEWLRATLFTGYAWNPLGVVWLPLPGVARIAALIGSYGLSGVTILAAGALLWLARRSWIAGGVVAALLVVLALVPVGGDNGRGALVRIVQPNIGQQEKWDKKQEAANFVRLAGLTGKPGPAPRLILWPEAAVPDYLEDEPWARARLARLLGPRDRLMTGGVAIEWDKHDRAIGARNSMFILGPDARIAGRYDKAHLVPYGEYLPMRPVLSLIGLSRLAPGDLDFWPGPGPLSYDVAGFGRVGVQICYEIVFSGHVLSRARRPDFLFNPSNDAWFGPSGPPQHLAQARLRAIEEGMTIVRATPTGISAVIDPHGRLLAFLPQHAAGAIERRLPAALPPTPFARLGNVLPLAFALLLALAGIALRRRAR